MDRARSTIRLDTRAWTIALALAIALWMGAAGAEIEPVFAHEVATHVAHAATFDRGTKVDPDDEVTELDLHRPKAKPGIAPYFHRSALDLGELEDAVQSEGSCGARGERSFARTHARSLEGC